MSQHRRPPNADEVAQLEEHIANRTIHICFLKPAVTVQCACEPRSDVSKKLFAPRKLSRVSLFPLMFTTELWMRITRINNLMAVLLILLST